jgi:hypothetical protein
MVGLSVACERVTETIKQWAASSKSVWLQNCTKNAAIVQMVAIVGGVLVTALSGLNPLNMPGIDGKTFNPYLVPTDWAAWTVTGVLVSGGSAFWNHLLDILRATKVEKEQQAAAGSTTPS